MLYSIISLVLCLVGILVMSMSVAVNNYVELDFITRSRKATRVARVSLTLITLGNVMPLYDLYVVSPIMGSLGFIFVGGLMLMGFYSNLATEDRLDIHEHDYNEQMDILQTLCEYSLYESPNTILIEDGVHLIPVGRKEGLIRGQVRRARYDHEHEVLDRDFLGIDSSKVNGYNIPNRGDK